MKACRMVCLVFLLCAVAAWGVTAQSEEEPEPAETKEEATEVETAQERPLVVAVLGFSVSKELQPDMAENLSTLLSAYLSIETDLEMVEREQLDKAVSELGLSLSGAVNASDAVKVGNLVGAKVLVTGRAFSLNSDLTIVVKIIGTETSRVFGLVTKSETPRDVDEAVMRLAGMIERKVEKNAKSFVAPTPDEKARIERIKEALRDMEKPRVLVIAQEIHRGPALIDPAAETEINFYLTECGFKTVDKDEELKKGWAAHFMKEEDTPPGLMDGVDVVIVGEAISEFALRKGDLVSCKARVELKAVDTESGELLAVGRETTAAVDVTESTAAKSAVQKGAAILAERIIPKMVSKWNEAREEE